VKNVITGYGRATKSEVASKITELLRIAETPKPDDVTDALAIAATYIFQDGTSKNRRSPQED
jgi:crossover junction endodeoxyribonuclease RuvC